MILVSSWRVASEEAAIAAALIRDRFPDEGVYLDPAISGEDIPIPPVVPGDRVVLVSEGGWVVLEVTE